MKFAVISLAVLSLVALVGSVFSAPFTEDLERLPELDEWEAFKSKHMKSYPSAEHESYRKSIYAANKKKVTDHNNKLAHGNSDQHLRLNHLADLTDEEYRHMCGGKALPDQDREAFEIFVPTVGDSRALPASVDWRTKGAVTPVKDQGACGSCWAFSGTGALEGQWFLKKGKLVSLSEQNLVDCSTASPNKGCDGGNPAPAFQYIMSNGGIDTSAAYPYDSMNTQHGRNTCRFKSSGVGAQDSGYVQVAQGDEAALKDAVANIGPISAMIDATPLHVQFPPTGVIGINDSTCKTDPKQLNHFVLVVGYGTLNNQDYWLIKNSWGKGWGDQGYAKMARNKKNYCGIASFATYPKVV